jgi:hypothetical protein
VAGIMKALASVVSISVLLITSSFATPSQLYRKTVAVSYSFSGTDTDGNRGRADIEYIIYVSATGRLFVRRKSTVQFLGGFQSKIVDTEPRERKTPDGFPRDLRFEGRHLIGKSQFFRGAALITIDFDPDFRRCTVNVVFGKENGAPMRMRRVEGGFADYVSARASALTCSIKEGNALAGE